MLMKMLGACLLAFLFSAVFGRKYIPWLEKKNARQPLKDEVAKIYKDRNSDENEGV